MLIGGIEAGGTKMVCAVADENGNIKDRISLPTGQPEETLAQIIEYFKKWEIEALGIGCFGPLDLDRIRPLTGILPKHQSPVGGIVTWWVPLKGHCMFRLVSIQM